MILSIIPRKITKRYLLRRRRKGTVPWITRGGYKNLYIRKPNRTVQLKTWVPAERTLSVEVVGLANPKERESAHNLMGEGRTSIFSMADYNSPRGQRTFQKNVLIDICDMYENVVNRCTIFILN